MTYLRYIADQPRPLATGEYAAANRRCWSSIIIIHVNGRNRRLIVTTLSTFFDSIS